MATLTEDQKRFVVQRLACFRTPSEVVQDVKEEFGITPSKEQVRNYNPLQVDGVAPKWRAIFEATRAAFVASAADEALAYQAVRVREYGRLYRAAWAKGNRREAREVLKGVAEELGGVYTSARQITGKDGGPIESRGSQVVVYMPSNGRESEGDGGASGSSGT